MASSITSTEIFSNISKSSAGWSPTPSTTRTASATPPDTTTTASITAIDGNLFIRRGPHLAFNPIGVLYEGQTEQIIGRDILENWVQVRLPAQPGNTGWISVQTRYSKVSGEVTEVPVVDTRDWPLGAYLRNCTHHQMLAQPGEYFIPSAYEFPDNEITVFPGIYTIYDLDVIDEPEVMANVDIREGAEVEIREDADGERRKCP